MVPLKFLSTKRKHKSLRRDYARKRREQPMVMKQLAEAYHKSSRPVWFSWLFKLSPLIVVAVLLIIIYSPLFRIRNVVINNIPFRETEGRLQAALQQFFQTRRAYILPQANLIFFNATAARQILSRELYSNNVVFERHWPNVLKVNYQPGNIVSLWQNQGKIFAVDQAGRLIQELTNTKIYNFNLLLVEEAGGGDRKLGDIVATDQLINLLQNLPTAWSGNIDKYKIERVVVDVKSLPTVNVYTPDDWYVQVSAEEDLIKQMQVLKRLLEEKIKGDINRIQYIDVRFIKKASYTFKK
ncbi:MAG: hypothetical protein HY973_03780 [Candidatus Kerfeldbacteria bacterium]|nr:hypothetical protein [Candidatus Kerfeldbacteria bacterium]